MCLSYTLASSTSANFVMETRTETETVRPGHASRTEKPSEHLNWKGDFFPPSKCCVFCNTPKSRRGVMVHEWRNCPFHGEVSGGLWLEACDSARLADLKYGPLTLCVASTMERLLPFLPRASAEPHSRSNHTSLSASCSPLAPRTTSRVSR